MNQSFDAFATLLGTGTSACPYPSPPTTASVAESRAPTAGSLSSSSLEEPDELLRVASYAAVAPPPSPDQSHNVARSSVRSRLTPRSRPVGRVSIARASIRKYKKSEGQPAPTRYPSRLPKTIPEHVLEDVQKDDSIARIFFPSLPKNEANAPPLTSGVSSQTSSIEVCSQTVQRPLPLAKRGWATGFSRHSRPSRPSPAATRVESRLRNMSPRVRMRRTSAGRSTSGASSPLTDSSQHPIATPTTCVVINAPTVSSPLSSPDGSSGVLSPGTRSPSPCSSNVSNTTASFKRYGRSMIPFPELSFYRRSRILRSIQNAPPIKICSSRESIACSAPKKVPKKPNPSDRSPDGTDHGSTKDEDKFPTENSEITTTVTRGMETSPKKSTKLRRGSSREIATDEQAVRDEISYLRNQYLPKLLAEAEAEGGGKRSTAGRGSAGRGPMGHGGQGRGGRPVPMGARPPDVLLLRAGLLPAHLSPWRRSLAAQLRGREEARFATAQRQPKTPESPISITRPHTPNIFSAYVQKCPATTETIFNPRSKSFESRNSLFDTDDFPATPTVTPIHTPPNSMDQIFPPSASPLGADFYPAHRLLDPALVALLRRRSSDCVLETRRVPPQTREGLETRRWQTLLCTAGVQRRAAEEQRRRRRGEGAHEAWAWRARQQPRPLVGSIFDRKPFFGAPGPNCNPLPWQN